MPKNVRNLLCFIFASWEPFIESIIANIIIIIIIIFSEEFVI